MISLTRDDIDIRAAIEKAKKPNTGAIVSFLGIVRDDSIESLEFEAYEEFALKDLETISDTAVRLHNLNSVYIVHRIGKLLVGDNILLIVCGAGHRKEAFEGCEYIIEKIKEHVPIWKKEIRKDGDRWIEGDHR